MFRIACFCDDNKLGKVLIALQGLVIMDGTPMPVVNAKRGKDGKLEAETSGTLLDMFTLHLRKTKVKLFPPAFVQEFVIAQGRSVHSYSPLISKAIKAKLIKRGKNGESKHYEVLRHGK